MTAFLSADNLSFRLGNGDYLFHNISFSARSPVTAIVGVNGVGKSVLARCLSGELATDDGVIQSYGLAHYVPQGVSLNQEGLPAIELFDLAEAFGAAQRVSQGAISCDDLVCAQCWWERSAEIADSLRKVGLSDDLDLQRPVTSFSGGEQFRLRWAAVLMREPDLFIFDEPTNHLDREGRAHFFQWICQEQKPLLVISHDRDLLHRADVILEMTSSAMYAHSGGYQDYLIERDQRWCAQQHSLNCAKKVQRRQAIQAQQALEKQQQRAARGRAKAEQTGLDKMLRNAMIESAESSQGQQKVLRQQRKNRMELGLLQAEQQQEWAEPLKFELPGSYLPNNKIVLSMDGLVSGIDEPNHEPISTALEGPFRLRLDGRNGSGKSILMKTIFNLLSPVSGCCKTHVPTLHLDQHFNHYDSELSAIENLLRCQPTQSEQEGRERLAQVRLRNKKADVPFGKLSGGEQLKAVLAMELLGVVTPQLILLDEPTNHLDLDSTLMLEQALRQYQGALIIISHDEHLVHSLDLTHQLTLPESVIEIWS